MSKHVLIVDDEPAFRFSAGIALRQAGYLISEAENAEEALSILFAQKRGEIPIDAVLLDIHMPMMTGLELLAAVESSGIKMPPTIVISGYADGSIESDLKMKGYYGILHKPFEPSEMVKMVDQVLNS